MPIYDFRCRECGKVSEIFLRGAGQTARCPACGSDNMREAYLIILYDKNGFLSLWHHLLRQSRAL